MRMRVSVCESVHVHVVKYVVKCDCGYLFKRS